MAQTPPPSQRAQFPTMIEILLVAAIAVVLAAAAAGEGVAPLLYLIGAGAVGLGLTAGVPAGIAYHVKLFRALLSLGPVEHGWWWRPTSYHERLPERQRREVLPWFHAGAAGFVAVIAGCVLVAAALLAQ